MAHALDHFEPGAGDQLGGAAATLDVDQRVAVAVDDEEGQVDLAEQLGTWW